MLQLFLEKPLLLLVLELLLLILCKMLVVVTQFGNKTAAFIVNQQIPTLSMTDVEKIGQDIDGKSHTDKFGYSVSLNAYGNRVAIGGK